MPFAVEEIDDVEVFVRDTDAAARSYSQVLGLREVARWDPEPVVIGSGRTKLALLRAGSDASQKASGSHWHRVAWRTDRPGFEAAQRHLTELGIKFRGPIDHRLAHSIYFEEPEDMHVPCGTSESFHAHVHPAADSAHQCIL